jgi:hypothetical protein
MNAQPHVAKILTVLLMTSLLELGLGIAWARPPAYTPVRTLAAPTSTQTDIIGPLGSASFGTQVVALPNGNIVVTDPAYDGNKGAVYLYNGATGVLVSALLGSTAGDQVGSGGVITLTNGNYVMLSPNWANGVVTQAGAVTWGNGATGITSVVSATNSLVGSTLGDQVGIDVTPLSNGNYVVSSPAWDNGAATNAGAATWGNGMTGITGVVSTTNSLVGSTADNQVGIDVTALNNGGYVVLSPNWTNGVVTDAGAVTWGNGATGITGVVSATNSLVGSQTGDQVGYVSEWDTGVTLLSNGNYVVSSPNWANGVVTQAGAVTWGNGVTGITGVVSVTNSLVGDKAGDQVGYHVTALSNGNYVVGSPNWANGAATNAGAATWGNGMMGITGVVSSTNSLVGSKAGDRVGYYGALALCNDNYVVISIFWANGAATRAGAMTWGNGATGITGVVSVTNSLVGSTANDFVGNLGAAALSNGNYVVFSLY